MDVWQWTEGWGSKWELRWRLGLDDVVWYCSGAGCGGVAIAAGGGVGRQWFG